MYVFWSVVPLVMTAAHVAIEMFGINHLVQLRASEVLHQVDHLDLVFNLRLNLRPQTFCGHCEFILPSKTNPQPQNPMSLTPWCVLQYGYGWPVAQTTVN